MMSDLECWIWFSELRSLRFRTRSALLERFGGAKEIWFADRREIEALSGLQPEERRALSERNAAEAERIVRRCSEAHIRILTFQDAAYPERLRNIPDPPYVLYVLGELPDVDTQPLIAVVGTRRSSLYGERTTRSIASQITLCGGIVVTGLAAGIDSAAAEGALDTGGPVIGVLGVAIDKVYPSSNASLYARVKNNGALISEYPPDAVGNKEWFPQRNRIIAALSLGVVVPEAPARSGALITAHRALDYGRDVFAVPANADSAKGRGSNRLIREGAALITSGWDVMQEYEALFPERIRYKEPDALQHDGMIQTQTAETETPGDPGNDFLLFRQPQRSRADENKLAAQLGMLSEQQLKIIAVMNKPSMHVDDIIDLAQLPAAAVLSELTILQIKGYVRQEPGKRFTLNISK